MALTPSEVLHPKPKSPEHSREEILQIADVIETTIDAALKQPTLLPEYDGSILLGVALEGARITHGVIAEVTRRYLKAKKNPDGWGTFSIETLDEYIAVTLNARTEEEIIAANEQRRDDWMSQRPD